ASKQTAQGSALGFNQAKKERKGKSIHILNNAFALSGRVLASDLYLGRCPGLFARWPYRPHHYPLEST
ncbi:MAG: hypothetical protein IKH22_00965, partial [Prevotella sp.]|nr:hypothetical protein [Prevotella sp.]